MAAATPAIPAQPAGAGGPAGASGKQVVPKGGPVLSAAVVEEWIVESIASAPPADKVHISTHLKACVPALLDRLK